MAVVSSLLMLRVEEIITRVTSLLISLIIATSPILCILYCETEDALERIASFAKYDLMAMCSPDNPLVAQIDAQHMGTHSSPDSKPLSHMQELLKSVTQAIVPLVTLAIGIFIAAPANPLRRVKLTSYMWCPDPPPPRFSLI